MRPAAALFPLAGLIASLLGAARQTAALFAVYYILQLLTLCAADCFRNAAAREPGMRRVDRRFGGALIQMLPGLFIGAFLILNYDVDRRVIFTATFLIIEHLFEERLYALARPADGAVLSVVSGLLLAAGLLLDSAGGVTGPFEGFYTFCGTSLTMLIALVTSFIMEGSHGFSPVPRNIVRFPGACVQTLLYPAACIPLLRFTGIAPALAGLVLWRLSRTLCRRTADESRRLNLLLVAASAILVVAGLWISLAWGFMALLASVCAAIVFCAPGVRLYIGIVLLAAALALQVSGLLPGQMLPAAVPAACALAVVLNLKRAFLKKV